MPYKDPQQRREYQREWQRQRRAGVSGGDCTPSRTLNPDDVKTAKGMLDVLAETISDVQAWEGDTLQRARCMGYLVSIGIKAVETAELAERLDDLEAQLEHIQQ